MSTPAKIAGTIADQAARDAIASDLEATIVVEAAAGTGKTTALVSRIVAVIASGRGTLAHIVAVTFTEKAAGELKLRLRAEIERARNDDSLDQESRDRLGGALRELEQASIGTIHSFCADLLRERPVEARVDPMFEVAAEDTSGAILELAFARWFESALASPGEGMRRLLRRRESVNRDGPRAIARRAAEELLAWRDFTARWERFPFERDREIDAIVTEVTALASLARDGEPGDWLAKSLEEIARPVIEAMRLEAVRGRDHDALEAVLLTIGGGRRWDWKGFGGGMGGVERETIFQRRAELRDRIARMRRDAGANLAPVLREELWPIIDIYDSIKRREGQLDFLDLLLVARNLVRDNPVVRAELQSRFTHIFIDEFQDTDPLQAEILLLLAADDPATHDWRAARPIPGKLFIVGDPKQSIYRFRRADVALYQEVKQSLIAAGARLLFLAVSFRATPELHAMINAAFAPLMAAESPTQPAYAPLTPVREDPAAQPSIVALPVPDPYGDYGRVTDWQIEQSLPEAIAAFAAWMIKESGWTVTEREAPERRVAIAPRHICILFRRLSSYGRDVTRPYLRALEARHLPHVLVKGGSFNDREEVTSVRNLLAAIERPDDELAVFATLRGVFFSLGDDLLLEYREAAGGFSLWRHPPQGHTAQDASGRFRAMLSAREIILELHRERNRRPIAQTLARALAQTRAHAGVAIWPTGDQALANIMRLMDQARRYEARSRPTSFRGFVDELEARAERDEPSETPLAEEGTEGVRIMTVHRAKGLEFPIVILADITCNETAGEPARFIDPARGLAALRIAGCAPNELLEHQEEEHRRDVEEAIRLLYVATTRARDLLIVPALGDGAYDGWLARLNPVIYPEQKDRRAPIARKPPGCPEFGEDSVRTRPMRAPAPTRSIAPGSHRAQAGAHRVVWWDPTRLILDVKEAMGLRQSALLEADSSGEISEHAGRAHRAWSEARGAALARGGEPTLKIVSATAAAHGGAHDMHDTRDTNGSQSGGGILVEEIARDRSRARFRLFGTLVHETMLRIRFDIAHMEIEQAASSVARMIGAGADDVEAAIGAVTNALGSQVIRDAARASEVRREYPVLTTLDDGTTAEGIADLAFRSGSGGVARWTIVEFKTDADLSRRLPEYRAQLAIYMRAVRAATGTPATGVILWI
ncbi:MAG: UvrD-helicase domain-containing protein [Candidatus Binataceae bacterium]